MLHHHEEIIKAWGCSSHGEYLEAVAAHLELPAPKVQHHGGVAGVACLVGGVLAVASEGGQSLYYAKGH